MKDVGLSLPPDYLAGRSAGPVSALLQATVGDAPQFLAELRKRGVTWVELRSLAHGANAATAARAAQTAWDAGMSVTVHGALPPQPPAPSFAGAFPELTGVLAHLPAHQGRLIVTVHARSAAEADVHRLRQDTAAALDIAMELAEREGWPVRFALELNREKGQVDPGTTYEGLLAVCRLVDHPGAGICWDFGHTWANVRNGLLTLEPPAEFCARVVHTHIHGLGPDGTTHHGVSDGDPPLGRFLAPLLAAGYSGVLNLELSPDRLAAVGDVSEQIFASVDALRA